MESFASGPSHSDAILPRQPTIRKVDVWFVPDLLGGFAHVLPPLGDQSLCLFESIPGNILDQGPFLVVGIQDPQAVRRIVQRGVVALFTGRCSRRQSSVSLVPAEGFVPGLEWCHLRDVSGICQRNAKSSATNHAHGHNSRVSSSGNDGASFLGSEPRGIGVHAIVSRIPPGSFGRIAVWPPVLSKRDD